MSSPVERVVHELGEILAAGAVAAGERRDGNSSARRSKTLVSSNGSAGASSSAGIPEDTRNGVGFCVTGSPKTTT